MAARQPRWVALAFGIAVGLYVSTAAYAATSSGVLGPHEPPPGGDVDAYIADYLAYRRALFPYEQVENWCLTVALLAIAVLTFRWALGGEADRHRRWLPASLVIVGSLVSAVIQIAYLGAMERVLEASHVASFDPAPLGTIVDVVLRTDDYVENLGWLLMAAGLVGMAREPGPHLGRLWRASCLGLAAGLVATAATSFAALDAGDVVLLVVGAVLAPVWVVLLGRLLDASSTRPARA